MPLLAPPTPEEGDDILPWARRITELLRALIPRPSRDIFPQIGSTGTTFALRRRRRAPAAGGGQSARPFLVSPSSPPEGEPEGDPAVGWVEVSAWSWLMKTVLPDDKITITGLGYPFRLEIDSEPRQYIWLEINLDGIYEDPVEPITATIQHGEDWNGDDGDFFPAPVSFNTDDGTPGGSDPEEPPVNGYQDRIYVPIAYTYPVTDESALFGEIVPPGLMLSPEVKLVQVLDTHLVLMRDCLAGVASDVWLTRAHHLPIPPLDED